MTAERCTDCPEPATTDQYAGYVRVGDHFVAMTRPMCAWCAAEDARARVEAMCS